MHAAGTTPHHYTFVLIATDLDPKALPPGLTRLELLDKLNGHAKGSTDHDRSIQESDLSSVACEQGGD